MRNPERCFACAHWFCGTCFSENWRYSTPLGGMKKQDEMKVVFEKLEKEKMKIKKDKKSQMRNIR